MMVFSWNRITKVAAKALLLLDYVAATVGPLRFNPKQSTVFRVSAPGLHIRYRRIAFGFGGALRRVIQIGRELMR
jgi:hypothetical protein